MAMAKDIIGDILKREGSGIVSNDPLDKGGRTQYGISERSNPEAWVDNHVTEAEARAIYETKYLHNTHIDQINDLNLRAQLLDWTVNSGPYVAIAGLQRILALPEDGILGPKTLGLVNKADAKLLGNLLVAERVKMIGRVVVRNPSQLKFISGWLNRALEFLS